LVLNILQNAKREELEQTLASKLDMKKASKLCNEVSAYILGFGPVSVLLSLFVLSRRIQSRISIRNTALDSGFNYTVGYSVKRASFEESFR
jgi:hypothetical protein